MRRAAQLLVSSRCRCSSIRSACAARRDPWCRADAATSSELLQEPEVVLVQEAQAGDAVLERRDALDPHPPREALVALGVVAVLAHVAEHRGVDLAGAEQLDPPLALADGAAGA